MVKSPCFSGCHGGICQGFADAAAAVCFFQQEETQLPHACFFCFLQHDGAYRLTVYIGYPHLCMVAFGGGGKIVDHLLGIFAEAFSPAIFFPIDAVMGFGDIVCLCKGGW